MIDPEQMREFLNFRDSVNSDLRSTHALVTFNEWQEGRALRTRIDSALTQLGLVPFPRAESDDDPTMEGWNFMLDTIARVTDTLTGPDEIEEIVTLSGQTVVRTTHPR